VHDRGYYDAHDIEVLTGRKVAALDLGAHEVELDDGERLPFTAAVLATGAEPRQLDIPGGQLDGVHYLRTLDDSRRLGAAIRGCRRLAVIGAGWIGSEVAASACQLGADVVLIDPLAAPLYRVLGAQIADVFSRLHADHDVELRMNYGVTELRGDNAVEGVVLSDGAVETADLVVIGVGVAPRVELATAAGLEVDNGVVVDEQLRASVPGVFAAGDIASAWHPHFERRLRVEHWANALNQGSTAGVNAAGGSERYDRLPYFFSDQYDLGMEYVGHADPDDEVVVRGSLADREFIAFWRRDGAVTAAMNVNVWDVVDDLKAIITSKQEIPAQRLADGAAPLAELPTR
jgi:3-phenylpropionate/trans-cinnamate dioxygenase ferredoxin reductase subunit